MVKEGMAQREAEIRQKKEAELRKVQRELERLQEEARKRQQAADAAAAEGGAASALDPHPPTPSPNRTHNRPGEGEQVCPCCWVVGGAPLPGAGSADGRGDGGEGSQTELVSPGDPEYPHAR